MQKHMHQLLRPWKGEVAKATTAGLLAGTTWLLAHIGLDTGITVAELSEALGVTVTTYFLTWLKPNK